MKAELKHFADLIQTRTGIHYDETSSFQLEKRLIALAAELNLHDLGTLWLAVSSDRSNRLPSRVLDLATNNETSFFRDPGAFRAFTGSVVPKVLPFLAEDEPLRVWSAAASTGQEMISVRIALAEMIGGPAKVEMLVTDISDRVLERCRAGRYSDLEVGRGLSPHILTKYFNRVEGVQEEGNWVIKSEFLTFNRYERLNLVSPTFANLGSFHTILCRNVLIYQQKSQREKIVSFLTNNLAPGGYLWVGASESLVGLSDDLDQVMHAGFAFYRKKERK